MAEPFEILTEEQINEIYYNKAVKIIELIGEGRYANEAAGTQHLSAAHFYKIVASHPNLGQQLDAAEARRKRAEGEMAAKGGASALRKMVQLIDETDFMDQSTPVPRLNLCFKAAEMLIKYGEVGKATGEKESNINLTIAPPTKADMQKMLGRAVGVNKLNTIQKNEDRVVI